MKTSKEMLNDAGLIFWDFDGVIKDSIEVKSNAFFNIFMEFGVDVAYSVKRHHEENGGLSRLVKIPLYLKLAGLSPTDELVSEYCDRFSSAVLTEVINSPWVPGVRRYLMDNYTRQCYVLLTATPQCEINKIVTTLNISHCFSEIYGSPIEKQDAIASTLLQKGLSPKNALMIGDSVVDLNAAISNDVPFILRCSLHNRAMQVGYSGVVIEDFTNV